MAMIGGEKDVLGFGDVLVLGRAVLVRSSCLISFRDQEIITRVGELRGATLNDVRGCGGLCGAKIGRTLGCRGGVEDGREDKRAATKHELERRVCGSC